jgi:hypothetical protein
LVGVHIAQSDGGFYDDAARLVAHYAVQLCLGCTYLGRQRLRAANYEQENENDGKKTCAFHQGILSVTGIVRIGSGSEIEFSGIICWN